MNHVAVTLEYPSQSGQGANRRDMALPLDVPLERLARALVHDLHIPLPPGQVYRIAIEADGTLRFLPQQATLGQMRILHGMTLRMVPYADSPPPLVRAYLRAENALNLPIRQAQVLIGRASPKRGIFVDIDVSDLTASPQSISRRHAQIEYREGAFYIRDLGSKNGTFVNGERLLPNQLRRLMPGDVIDLGKPGTLRFIFEYEDEAPQSS